MPSVLKRSGLSGVTSTLISSPSQDSISHFIRGRTALSWSSGTGLPVRDFRSDALSVITGMVSPECELPLP